MTARVLIQRSPDLVTVFVDGRLAASASNDDDVPGEVPLSPPTIAAAVAEDVARALGATVEVQQL